MTSFSSHSKERNKGSISLSMGPLYGKLEYKVNTLLSGSIDQKFSGTRFGVKIIKTRKNNSRIQLVSATYRLVKRGKLR
jgi:hypothetical protein